MAENIDVKMILHDPSDHSVDDALQMLERGPGAQFNLTDWARIQAKLPRLRRFIEDASLIIEPSNAMRRGQVSAALSHVVTLVNDAEQQTCIGGELATLASQFATTSNPGAELGP